MAFKQFFFLAIFFAVALASTWAEEAAPLQNKSNDVDSSDEYLEALDSVLNYVKSSPDHYQDDYYGYENHHAPGVGITIDGSSALVHKQGFFYLIKSFLSLLWNLFANIKAFIFNNLPLITAGFNVVTSGW